MAKRKWKNDAHGICFPCNEVKLYASGKHTWAMKLPATTLKNGVGKIRIATYSLPDIEYCYDRFRQSPQRFTLICHRQFWDRAEGIKNALPEIAIYTHPEIHSKICLREPETIYLGSANFGKSNWIESNIGIRSKMGHDWLINNFWLPVMEDSRTLEIK